MKPALIGQGLIVLDFDIECRPIAWYGGDFVTKQPTGIAWKFLGSKERPTVAYIGASDRSSKVLDEERAMLEAFVLAYDYADIVTGHYIRAFDLPVLNGSLMRLGMPGLSDKLSHDTKLDLAKRSGLSTSQENLGAMFELEHPKIDMNTAKWARANMLLPDGIAEMKKRVVGDVEQHIELRAEMMKLDLLRPPSIWSSRSVGGSGKYHA